MIKVTALGQQLKGFRLDRGWSQTRLGALFGVSRGTIARLEAGQKIRDLTRVKIEKALAQMQVAA